MNVEQAMTVSLMLATRSKWTKSPPRSEKLKSYKKVNSNNNYYAGRCFQSKADLYFSNHQRSLSKAKPVSITTHLRATRTSRNWWKTVWVIKTLVTSRMNLPSRIRLAYAARASDSNHFPYQIQKWQTLSTNWLIVVIQMKIRAIIYES